MRRSPILILLLATALPARTAAADTGEPPVGVALAAGAASALLPMTLGAMHTANAPVRAYGLRNVGYIVAGAGLVLAPIVSHVIVGEYKRAAAFGALPVAAQIAMTTLVAVKPDAIFSGNMGSRAAFGLTFAASAFNTAFALVDVALAGERARASAAPKAGSIGVAPMIGGGQIGMVAGGTW